MIAPLNDHAVHTEHLTKIYKDFWGRDKVRALDDLSLTKSKTPLGSNLIENGDFEAPLSKAWSVGSNHLASTISTVLSEPPSRNPLW